jgi:thiol-disulfide isomerase/thioredoxin
MTSPAVTGAPQDASAEQLLQESIAKMRSLDKLQFESILTMHLSGRDSSVDVTNFIDISAIRSKGFKGTYDGRPVPARAMGPHLEVNQFLNADAPCLLVSCDLNSLSEGPPPVKPVITMVPGIAEVGGKRCQVVSYKIGGGFPEEYKFFIGPDKIVYRVYHYAVNMGRPYTYDSVITKLDLNPALQDSDFDLQSGEELARREMPADPPATSIATDFTLATPNGRQTSLKEAMKGKRVLLLNFWFIDCPPCRSEHPHLNALNNELKDKGFGLLSIDVGDKAADVANYLKNAGLEFNVALQGPYKGPGAKQLDPYQVHACPTNILIDCATGKVISRLTGWNEAELRATLAGQGIK